MLYWTECDLDRYSLNILVHIDQTDASISHNNIQGIK